MWDLQEMQAWIMMGGAAAPVTIVPMRIMPLTDPKPPALSDSKSEVGVSNEELPTLQQVLSKVWQVDDINHMLYKGVWAMTPATCRGWEIFVQVSCYE